MKLLICQSCGVVIRTKGKHCSGCGIQLALNSPTAMPNFPVERPPLAVRYSQDHLLLERVVTERQVSVMTLRPQVTSTPMYDDGGEDYSPSNGYAGYGGNGGNGNGGNGGNGHDGYGGNGGGSPYATLQYADPAQDPNGFGWSNSSSQMTPAEGRFVDPGSQNSSSAPSGEFWNSDPQPQAQPAAPSSGSGFYNPGSPNDYYLKNARESVELIEEPEPPALPKNKAVEALGEMSLEDSSTDFPTLASAIPAARDLEAQDVQPETAAQPQSSSITNPSMHLAGFGAHPGAAISIAIGAGIGVGAVANQMLNKRAEATQSPSDSQSMEPTQSTAPVRESVALEPGAPATESPLTEPSTETSSFADNFAPGTEPGAARDSQDDFFEASSKSELEDFFGPQTKAEPERNPVESDLIAETNTSDTASTSLESFSARSAAPGADTPMVPVAPPAPITPVAATPSVEPPAVASPEPEMKRAESSSFFGDDDNGFDFFSSPASAAARKQSFSDDADKPNASSPTVSADISSEAPSSATQQQTTDSAVDSTAQDRPKVAMPKSLTQTQTKTRLKVSDDDANVLSSSDVEDKLTDEEDDDDDDDTPKYKPPKRRNFSGDETAPKSRAKTITKAVKKGKVSDDDEDDDDDTSGASGGALGWLEEDVKFIGLNVSRKTAGVLCAVGLFIAIQIPGWVMSFVNMANGGAAQQQTAQAPAGGGMGALGGLGGLGGGRSGAGSGLGQGAGAFGGLAGQGAMSAAGGMPGQVGMQGMPGQGQPGQGMPGQGQQAPAAEFTNGIPVVGGNWTIESQVGAKILTGQMNLNQGGVNFAGQGKDSSGVFEIQGQLQAPDVIMFNMRYDQESRHKYNAHNEYIVFQGKLIPNGAQLQAVGAYQTQKRVGSSFSTLKPSKVIPIRGKWRASQTMVAANNPQAGAFALPNMGLPKPGLVNVPTPAATGKPGPGNLQQMFLTIAIGLVTLGVLIFLFFLKLFGPSGWMNVWEKQKYIPSQFRPDHMKMVREYGKPLTPGGTPFGTRMEWGWWSFWTPKFLNLPPDIRKANPHILCIGGGDKGKTRLMASMITHDIKSEDRAVVVIDSDGQLCDLIIEWIASQTEGSKYAKRVVLVDPTYKAGSLAYNPLEMPDDGDLQAASSAIVHGFKAIYTEPPGAQSQWNAQTANILRNAALLLMANGRTLTDLPNLLQDNDFRDIMLEAVERKKHDKTEYITILETWNQYKKLARTDQWINWVEPILNRVGPMLSDGRIRPILTKPVSDLKLKDIIKQKKILIVKVPQGELDQNANLLGSLIVTGIQQAAMNLSKSNNDDRPVSLYLDEMDSFIEKETIETITSETRRYQIGFIGSIKTLQHLPEDYRNQLTINMGTMAVFALAKKDGDMLGPQMFRVDGRKIKHQTIQNFFNQVNTSPQFELIMDEEKLNIDRIVGQEIQTYFCYRVGTVAGVFKMRAPDFKDISEKKINRKLVEKMHAITDSFGDKKKSKKSKDRDNDSDKAG